MSELPKYSAKYSIIIINKESDEEKNFGTFTTQADTYYELVGNIQLMMNEIQKQFNIDNMVMFRWEDSDVNLSPKDILG